MATPLKGRTERRLAVVILLTAVIPLTAGIMLAGSLFRQASALWFNPDIGAQLDRGLALYKDLVKALKDDMRHQTDAIAADTSLREAARRGKRDMIDEVIGAHFGRYPSLVGLVVEDEAGRVLARRIRREAVTDSLERTLEVRRPLSDSGDPPILVATFATDRKRLDELEAAGSIVAKYHQLEASRSDLYQGYFRAYAFLLAFFMLIAVALGSILAQGVTRRLARLANALNLVAKGDWTVRVPVTGSDELTELASIFNRMLSDMDQSRARIEYLQRMGAWQDMAQRLAHEIKNPLTPIQLAVQECHRKYDGSDVAFRNLLNTTTEIVDEEIGTLRRLVGTFSNFARMPHAEPIESNLGLFLRECSETLGGLDSPTFDGETSEQTRFASANIQVDWVIPNDEIVASIDRQLLRRVLANLVNNAIQAIRASTTAHNSKTIEGRVRVSAQPGKEGSVIVVEDSGPGVPPQNRQRIFDPYFTTKADGTGLGLAIAKKIIVEHGGTITVDSSPDLGGARFLVCLPKPFSSNPGALST